MTPTRSNAGAPRAYAGIFVLALSILALEVTLARLLSVKAWYHLAFLAISIAMLGLTAGATRIYLAPALLAGRDLDASVAAFCRQYALSVPLSLILLCLLPVEF